MLADMLILHHSSLFKRQRWDDSRAKGVQRHLPRLLYNINGQRKEWDAVSLPCCAVSTEYERGREVGHERGYRLTSVADNK